MDASVSKIWYYAITLFSPAMLKLLFSGSVAIVSNTYSLYELPGKTIKIQQRVYGKPKLNFLILHDDENTGKEAAEIYCSLIGGSITELCYGEVRNITFRNKNGNYAFDPNQMFESTGLYKSMRFYSKQAPTAKEIQPVRSLADSLLQRYKNLHTNCFITLHNNSEGNFNINSYLSGKLKTVADSVYVNPLMDADDLIFVTEASYYTYLQRMEINVMLQSTQAIDGSLSVYAQQRRIPYINIEIQHGHLTENLRLILVVEQMLKQLKMI